MTNPATTLLRIFTKWNGPINKSPHSIREFDTNPGASFKLHIEAIEAIADLSRTFDRLGSQGFKVANFQRGIQLVVKALLSVPRGWVEAGMQQVTITRHMLDVLEGMESFLDAHTLMLSPDGLTNVEGLLDQVINGLNDDPNLSAQLRAHILKVVQTIRNCIQEYGLTGETDLREALHDLWVSLYAAAGATTEQKRGFWQKMATNVGYPAAGSALGSLPAFVGTLALTQS